MNKEQQYNLYFSKIVYRKYYNIDNTFIQKCELHGDELNDNEIIEIKWNNGFIENHKVCIVSEEIGWNKQYTPYIVTKYNDTDTRICIGGLMARRLFEPKK